MYTKEELLESTIETLVYTCFEVSGSKDQFSQIISSMLDPIMQLCEQELGVVNQNGKLKELIENGKDEYFKNAVKIYANYYSKNQLADIIIFYQSPSGQSSVSYQLGIMNDLSVYGTEFATKLFKDYEKLILDAV